MDPKGKGIVINDKEKESFVNEQRDDKSNNSGSGHKRKDGAEDRGRFDDLRGPVRTIALIPRR